MWRIPNILPRVKHFVRRALSNSLPCNARRATVISNANPTFPHCGQGDESISHILLECVVAREAWVVSSPQLDIFTIGNAHQLYKNLCCSSSLSDSEELFFTPPGVYGKLAAILCSSSAKNAESPSHCEQILYSVALNAGLSNSNINFTTA